MSALKELKKQLKLFASFSAGERLSILFLFVLLLIVWLLLFLMPMWSGNTLAEKNAALQIVKSWEQEPRKKEVTTQIDHVALNSADKKVVPTLFLFNPNSVSEEQAIQLGMTARQINNIFNYRSKGGVFRKKSDLGKLYAFDSLSYQRLKPYIDLPDSFVKHAQVILLSANTAQLTSEKSSS
jgi:competence protein ComEA